MPRITIDNTPIDVPGGTSVLAAARMLGIEIPTLCHVAGSEPLTSCMACLVRVAGARSLLPSCATVATDGMSVQTRTPEVLAARRGAIELLLSEHVGDCVGPCQTACPAGMDIPLMIRQIAAGRLPEAVATVKRDIALPAILGRICPAPCERACRRGRADEPVAICLLKRHVADADLAGTSPYRPQLAPESGKRVAVVGAGPAGLAAGWHLRVLGHACTIFEAADAPGGGLRGGVDRRRLPLDVLDAEIATVLALGTELRTGVRVGRDVSLADLLRDFDAVLVAAGALSAEEAGELGAPHEGGRVAAARDTYLTGEAGIFAAGNTIRPKSRLAVRAVADGKEAAFAIDQHLRGREVTGPRRPFNSRIGPLLDGEIDEFMKLADGRGRLSPASPLGGFDAAQAIPEAGRCMHCDCRKADACLLRLRAEELGASQTAYKGEQRRRFVQQVGRSGGVIYEPGKCIDCGICIRVAAEHGEKLGLSFVGRGFDVRVAVPFARDIDEALTRAADACVAACPTGALALANGVGCISRDKAVRG
jgi:ferredoxin